jgi:hypothetical protein
MQSAQGGYFQTQNTKPQTFKVQRSQSGKYFQPLERIEPIEPFEHQPPKPQKPLKPLPPLPLHYPTIPYICPKNKITCNNLYHTLVY